MTNQNVYDYFTHHRIWNESMLNDTDSMRLSKIQNKRDFRNAFGVSESEELIYCRDSSFWNSRNQGCVITDWGIRVIPDNEKPEEMICVSWEEIDHVTYKDDVFFFWRSSEEDVENCCYIHKDYFSKNDESLFCWELLAYNFSQVAAMVQPQAHPIDLTIARMGELKENSPEEADKVGREMLGKYPQFDYMLNYSLGTNAFFSLKDLDLAKRYLTASLDDENNDDEFRRTWGHYLLSSALVQTGTFENPLLRYHTFMAAKGDNTIMAPSVGPIADDAANDLIQIEAVLAKTGYQDLSYEDHKLICPVNNLLALSDINQTQIRPVLLSALKDSECPLIFPVGHPVANEVYVCHPFDQKKYLLYENYEIELLEDKLREYCEIMQSLGATDIEVRVESSTTEDNVSKKEGKISGNVDALYSVSSSHEEQRNVTEKNSWARTFNRRQHFAPSKEVRVPDNTLWLAGEPSWQRTINQRLNGNLLSHHECISTNSSRVVSGNSARKLKAELETLFVDLGLEWTSSEEYTYSHNKSLTLSVDVVFGQPSESDKTMKSLVELSEAEKEYLEEFKLCLKDGSVSASERRLLDRMAKSLGLTASQIAKLEESATRITLTPEEQEYLAEYKECLADGEVTASTRRLLDRLARTLNLTAEQVNKIENL